MKTITPKWFAACIALACWVSCLPALAQNQTPLPVPRYASAPPAASTFTETANGEEAMEITTVVYPVADFLTPVPNHPYESSKLPTAEVAPTTTNSLPSGGGFGGGGAFNLMQFGGGTAPQMCTGPACGDVAAISMDDIVETIEATIHPATWETVGGPGSMRTLGTMLIVSQTKKVHGDIRQFIETLRKHHAGMQSVTTVAYWIELDSDELDRLQPFGRNGKRSIDRDELEKFVRAESSFRGQITCFSGQTVHIVSGERRSVVTGVMPVVGSEVGYQPQTAIPNIGVLLQLRPTVLDDRRSAVVDLQSYVTEGVIGAGGMVTAPFAGGSQLDRTSIKSQSLATTVRVPLGRPMLVGGLSVVPATNQGNAVTQYSIPNVDLPSDFAPSAPRIERSRPEIPNDDPFGGNRAPRDAQPTNPPPSFPPPSVEPVPSPTVGPALQFQGLAKKLEKKGDRRQLYLILELTSDDEAAADDK